jgi:hypothetical protein
MRRHCARPLVCWVAMPMILAAGPTHAMTLSERLGVFQPGFVTITPAILQLQRSLARATDFPATTTTPGITYRYDPSAGMFERVPGPLGPAFLERAETVGAGRAELSTTYLYARFNRFDGESLSDALSSRFVAVDGSLVVPERVETRDFSLSSHVTYFSGTYGVAGDFDLNLLLPVYYTAMDGERRFSTASVPGSFQSLDADAFGPGDLLLRAKYRFVDRNTWGVAAGLALHFPTGNEDNFQGTGDMVVTPSIIGSWQTTRLDVHGSLGIDINATSLVRSGVRYGVGASFAALDRLTLLADVVGTSGFSTEDVTFFVPDPRLVTIRGEFNPPITTRRVGNGTEFLTTLDREDVVDLAIGLKVILAHDLIWFMGVIVPLTQDGARAPAIPTGGLQYGF